MPVGGCRDLGHLPGVQEEQTATVPTMNSPLALPQIVLRITAIVFSLVALATAARADIFRWEYTNAADPSQGKRQSTTLAPGGAGVDAVPGADLSGRNLSMAYLVNANLSPTSICNPWGCLLDRVSNLSGTNLADADLTNADFDMAWLVGADFSGAEVRGANFGVVHRGLGGVWLGSGITLA
jgi:hypothetical protein